MLFTSLRPAQRAVAALVAATGIAAVVEAALHTWVSDDIFITLRYADNLLAGHGAVYNIGERVEGYTHFLWLMVLTVARAFGIDGEAVARWCALPAFTGCLISLVRLSSRLWPGRGGLAGIPVAMVAWAFHEDARRFGSGGLETAAFSWALLLGLEALLIADVARRGRIAAWAFAVATLLRPEGMLYSLLAGAALLWSPRGERHAWRDYALLWTALAAPAIAFRLAYYGVLFPNPFYAKSGGGAHWAQGWSYTSLYFQIYFALLAAVIALPFLVRELRAGVTPRLRALAFVTASVLLTLLYVIRVGGDFMFARFLLPVTPLLLLLIEDCVHRLQRPSLRWGATAALCVCLGLGAVLKHEKLGDKKNVAGIVNEPDFYPNERLPFVRAAATEFGKCIAGTDAVVLVQGGQARLAYFARFPVAIERYGLTDATIARSPIVRRGRPGHEKAPPIDYVYRRGVNLRVALQPLRRTPQYSQFAVGDIYGDIVVYDEALMEHMKTCHKARFLDFPLWLEQAYMPNIPAQAAPRLLADWSQFHHYYFNHNPHAAPLRERLRAALLAAGVVPPEQPAAPVLIEDPALGAF